MHEHGAGSTGHISAYGPCGNPWDPARCGGGSSGGSAAAVGARLVAGAVGTDGGGSIRYPAAYCGVTGLKLTWGLRARPTATRTRYSSMSAPGPLCRDAADARLLAEALVGRPLERRRAQRPAARRRARASGTTSTPRSPSCCQAAVDALREAGMAVTRGASSTASSTSRIATVLRLWLEDAAAVPPQIGARDRARPVADRPRAVEVPAPDAGRGAGARRRRARQLRRSLVDARSSRSDVLAWPTVAGARAADRGPDRASCPPGRVPADYANVRHGRDREPDRRAGAVGAVRPDARRAAGRAAADGALARGRAAARRRRAARAGHGPPARGRRAAAGTEDAGL